MCALEWLTLVLGCESDWCELKLGSVSLSGGGFICVCVCALEWVSVCGGQGVTDELCGCWEGGREEGGREGT